MRDSLTGNLLVASSLVTEPVYAGGVCLIVHQDDNNAIGVMLNRPLKPSAELLMEMLGQQPAPRNNRIATAIKNDSNSDPAADQAGTSSTESPLGMLHFGGPRSGPVVAIHQTSEFAEAEPGEGIYVAAQKHHLEELMRDRSGRFRLIVGHLGWQTEQLRAEIDGGIWHLVPATADTVFTTAGDMWPRLIRRATSGSLARWLGVPDVVNAGQLN